MGVVHAIENRLHDIFVFECKMLGLSAEFFLLIVISIHAGKEGLAQHSVDLPVNSEISPGISLTGIFHVQMCFDVWLDVVHCFDSGFQIGSELVGMQLLLSADDRIVESLGQCSKVRTEGINSILTEGCGIEISFRFIGMFDFRTEGRPCAVCEMLKKTLREQEEELPYYRESVKSMMLQLLVILFRKYQAEDYRNKDHSNKSKLMKQVAEYIKLHYHEELTVEKISEAFGYSRFHISKIFKEITGVTVVWYINATRIERAKTLLKNGGLSMSEIAMQCGFMNQSYFNKVFKRLENMSPLEYRARISE